MPSKRAPRRPASRPLPEPSPGFVAVGWVGAPRGRRGDLTIEPLTDFPQRFQPDAIVWAGGASYTVRHVRQHRRALLLELDGVETPEQAEKLRGLLLEVPEEELGALGEHQYFRFQLLGMAVVDRDGQPLGHIEEVLDTGANDVYIVRSPEGELLIPAIDTVVKQVDVAGKRMVVELIAGLQHRPYTRPATD
ncbi:MAG: 16S rRNA processing protein RimM [Chloroflexi bacterium]|nr:16S rRNA processing protein RimM [Chloroflexota bacterium]